MTDLDLSPDTGHDLDMSGGGGPSSSGSSSSSSITAPRIRVVPAPGSALAELFGPVAVVKAANPDLCAFDLTAYKHKWPPIDRAPFVWLTFCSWHAARRQGLIPSTLTFEAYRDQTEDVSAEDVESVDPTRPAPDPGSPSSWP